MDYLGKGLAVQMIQGFILSQYSDASEIIIDPEQSNVRAVHVYEKAGFKLLMNLSHLGILMPHYKMRFYVEDLKKNMIETDRLLIKKPILGDAKPLNDAINRSLAELQRWMPWANDPSLETTEKFIDDAIKQWDSDKQTDFPMIVVLKATGQIIGASGYNNQSNKDVPFYEIGYWLDTQYTGQGLATELTAALTDYAFTKYLAARVQIKIQASNEKSRNVAERCGFTIEARLHNYCIDCQTGKLADYLIYAMFDVNQLISK